MVSFKTSFVSPVFKKKILDVIKIAVGGTLTFAGIGIFSNNEKFYSSYVMPLFHLMDAENAHKFSVFMAKYNLVPHLKINSKMLETSVLGIKFPNPIGVAAGFDKNGEAVDGLFKMGFGFVEVGSVTPEPQPGNPKPRVFRLPSIGGIINRYGFNSDGHDAVLERLSKLEPPGQRKGVIGVNLGKNKDSSDPVQDYVIGVRKFGHVADYLVINVSSPNTPGLRNMQKREELEKLTSAVISERDKLSERKPPVLLKISPDLSLQDMKDIADIILKSKHRVDGLIISNTTTSRPSGVECEHLNETGGLSGKPLRDLSSKTLKHLSQLTKGKIPIIGVGGISCGEDAKERIYNGASLIQIYSALALQGPPAIKKITQELETNLRNDGFQTLSSAVGSGNEA